MVSAAFQATPSHRTPPDDAVAMRRTTPYRPTGSVGSAADGDLTGRARSAGSQGPPLGDGPVAVDGPAAGDEAQASSDGTNERPQGTEADPAGELFRSFATRVYGYVRLRSTPDIADDVVADTFLTAWRLRESVPDDPMPWLLVIARNALANRQRSARRGTRLVVAMASVAELAHHAAAAEDIAVDRAAVLAALASLCPEDREALLLVAWDGLTTADAATVAGCSQRTLARRLSRARRQLDSAGAGQQAAATPADRSSTPNQSKDS